MYQHLLLARKSREFWKCCSSALFPCGTKIFVFNLTFMSYIDKIWLFNTCLTTVGFTLVAVAFKALALRSSAFFYFSSSAKADICLKFKIFKCKDLSTLQQLPVPLLSGVRLTA